MSCISASPVYVLPWLVCWLLAGFSLVAASYRSNPDLASDLKTLARENPNVIQVSSIAKTRASHDVWLLRLGAGANADQRPAMLVVAGIEGNDLAGSASALAWATNLLSGYGKNDDQIRKLLDSKTIYILPRLNPDAADSRFARPRVERAISSLPVDEDHDGLLDEDGPEDLNDDGLITWMRVEDGEGEYMLDPVDPRLMLKADKARGEAGRWRYLTEGRDNDADEAWNEDPPGGVNFNRNFPFNYRFFGANAGVHQVSETETRALADFIVAHPAIAIVFTFGAADNLTQPPKVEAAGANRRPQTDVQPDDLPYLRELGKTWRDTLGLKKELPASSEAGTFSDWMYFHRGRLSLAARPWFPALQVELDKGKKPDAPKPDDQEKEKKDDAQGKKDDKKPDSRNEEERAFLKWLEAHAPEAFVTWRAINHPDFPGQTVEVGGYAPFARTNPPERLLPELTRKHIEFFNALVGKFPEVKLRKTAVKNLGESVYEITVQVENTGYLPTSLAQGEATREVHPTRLEISVDEKAILSGSKRTTVAPIAGSGGMREVRWVLHAPGLNQLRLFVHSTLGGSFESTIELR